MAKMPLEYFEYYSLLEPFAAGYYEVGQKEKARNMLSKLVKKQQELLTYYSSWKASDQNFSAMDIMMDIEQYRSFLEVAKNGNDLELSDCMFYCPTNS